MKVSTVTGTDFASCAAALATSQACTMPAVCSPPPGAAIRAAASASPASMSESVQMPRRLQLRRIAFPPAETARFWAENIVEGWGPTNLTRHPCQPPLDDGLGLSHDPLHQLPAGWDVLHQPHAGASGPDAVLQVAGLVDDTALGPGDERADLGDALAFVLHL